MVGLESPNLDNRKPDVPENIESTFLFYIIPRLKMQNLPVD
ncbi:MAG: hypothetical protein WAM88_06340 [Nitrososphaeraceae archaeon]